MVRATLTPPDKKALIFVLALGFALRLGWILLVPSMPVSDASVYHMLAQNMVATGNYAWPNGQMTSYWPVGAPALYALSYIALGSGTGAVALNLLLGTVMIALVYKLAREVEPRAALPAALIMALWPAFIQFTNFPNSERPFTVLLLGALAVRGRGSTTVLRSLAGVILLVGATYMRPIALPLLFLLPMAGWIKHRRATVMAKDLGVSLAAAAILMTPWALRNERLYGEPALVSTNLGVNLWMGNNPASDGGFMTPPKKTGNEDQQDKAFRAEAMTFIKAEPGRYVVLTLNRVRKTFDRETSGVTWNPALPDKLVKPLKLLSSLFWWIVASAALLGLTGWLRRDWRAVIDPLTLSPAVVVSTSVFIVASERYHMPVGPFAAIFAALLLARWNAPAFAPPAAAPERLPRGSQWV